MSHRSTLEWWDEWQLRILVLGSLGFQFALTIFAAGRKLNIKPWHRVIIWLSYLGSDAFAIYALATIFNRRKEQQCKSARCIGDLEVLWAPILLMHLGGQIFITAFNLEDNELWRRHIVTTISQVTVAIYVFCKSWSPSADKRLLVAAILLFFLGTAKCLEKSLSLRDASFNSLSTLPGPAQRTPTSHRENELEEFVQQARDSIEVDDQPPSLDNDATTKIIDRLGSPTKIFLDSGRPYSMRITTLKSFFTLDNEAAYRSLQNGLSNIFFILYTKFGISSTYHYIDDDPVGKDSFAYTFILWVTTAVVFIVTISLFHASHKIAYSISDIVVSVVLLYGTFVLDIISPIIFTVLAYVADFFPDVVAQHNLIEFCANNNKLMKPSHLSKEITSLVRGHVLGGWKKFITDAQSYRDFSDIRGHWNLEREGCAEQLGWSLEKPFDEVILVWHMATDLCFHHMDTSLGHEYANRSTEISNYMMHLMYVKPDMLMVGSRSNLFDTACNQLKVMLFGNPEMRTAGRIRSLFVTACIHLKGSMLGYDASVDKKKLTKEIINRVKSTEGSEETFIHDAWKLAEGLMNIFDDEKKMWEVIQGVWVEMLCFSASRCRGYLHAKSLGSGIEYLSYVWLLLSNAGMETYAERLQRTPSFQLSKEKRMRLQNQGEDTQGVELSMKKEENIPCTSSSQGADLCRDDETISASQTEGTAPKLEEIVLSP